MNLIDDSLICYICDTVGAHLTDSCPKNFCTSCGARGHRKFRCKFTPCESCGKTGHIEKHCPFRPECDICFKIGHGTDKCPNKERAGTYIRIPKRCRQQSPMSRPAQSSSSSVTLPTQQEPASPAHKSCTIGKTIIEYLPRDTFAVQSSILNDIHKHVARFPDIRKLAEYIVECLHEELWPAARAVPYFTYIQMHGGKRAVINSVLQSIPNEIFGLQGKDVTSNALDTIRDKQGYFEEWPLEGGYLDYVTDNNDLNFWRPYVGQSSSPSLRVHQHLRAWRKNRRDTLHYYYLSEGAGYRRMNFLRLWSLPAEIVDDIAAKTSRILLNNILEMVMCRAFQSLPNKVINELFSSKFLPIGQPMEGFLSDQNSLSTGLNVLPPIFQGVYIESSVRKRYTDAYKDSMDPQTKYWPQERQRQLEMRESARRITRNQLKTVIPCWSANDYLSAFVEAVNQARDRAEMTIQVPLTINYNSENVVDVTSLFCHISNTLAVDLSNLCAPFGSLSARVGIVMDRCPVVKSDNSDNIASNTCALPKILMEVGCYKENSLVWTLDFHQCFRPMIASSSGSLSQTQYDCLSEAHRFIIDNPNLKVILFNGENENLVLTPDIAATRTTMELRGCISPVYLEQKLGVLHRVYVHVDSLAFGIHAGSWAQWREFSEIFRFAAFLTESEQFHPYGLTSRFVSKEIILRYKSEEKGICDPMTMQSLDNRFREWLAIKGISQDHQIQMWEVLGGSLMRGLFLLLCTLPRISRRRGAHERNIFNYRRGRTLSSRTFTRFELDESRKMYTNFTGRSYQATSSSSSAQREIIDEAVDIHEDGLLDPEQQDPEQASEQDTREQLQDARDAEYHQKDGVDDNGALTSAELYDLIGAIEWDGITITAEEGEKAVVEGGISEQAVIYRGPSPDELDTDNRMRKSLLEGRHFTASKFKQRKDRWRVCALDNMLKIQIDGVSDIQEEDGMVLRLDICPPGQKHEHPYAFALNSDPASRVGLKVSWGGKRGTAHSRWITQVETAWKEVMLINSVFDWLSGLSWEQVAIENQPRRYIDIKENDMRHRTPILSRFIRGGFTDFSLSPTQQLEWEREKEVRDGKREKLRRKKVRTEEEKRKTQERLQALRVYMDSVHR